MEFPTTPPIELVSLVFGREKRDMKPEVDSIELLHFT